MSEFGKTCSSKRRIFLDYIDYLCGSYIIFHEQDGKLDVINDAGAVMKFFYALKEKAVIGAASDPKLLQEFVELNLDESPEARAFYTHPFFKKKMIRLGNKTMYEEVYQLVPNHLIHVSEASIERIFPRSPKIDLLVEESIQKLKIYFSTEKVRI